MGKIFIKLERIVEREKREAGFKARRRPSLRDVMRVRENARRMRREPTRAESVLIEVCRELGYRPIPQKMVGLRIVDVYLEDLDVAIEADGAQHFTKKGLRYDERRARVMAKSRPAMRILRYPNGVILGEGFKVRLGRDLAELC